MDDAIPEAQAAFGGLGKLVPIAGRAISSEHLKGADALVIRSVTTVDAALLEGTSLSFVGSATVGEDHVDRSLLRERGIAFANAAGCNAKAVAQWVLGAVYGACATEEDFDASLWSSRIGIVGYGNIGRQLATDLRALGREPWICDPPLARRTETKRLASWRSLAELRAGCGLLSFHVPLTHEGEDRTFHLWSGGESERGIGVLNCSRGPVVARKSLDRASPQSMALDVWEGEPELPWDALRDEKGPLRWASPHVAGYSLEGKLRATEMMHEALCRHLGAEPHWRGVPPDSGLELPHPGREETPFSYFGRCLRAVSRLDEDDGKLRALSERSGLDRAVAFEGLRRGYALRRELSAYRMPTSFASWPGKEAAVLQLGGCTVETALRRLGAQSGK